MMRFRNLVITGGAGFVGSNLAVLFKRAFPDLAVTAFDSLKRRGSELTLPRLRTHGVRFVHGDVRCPEDFDALPPFDLLLDCAAEPSVQAGTSGTPWYVLNTNLVGTIHCLEAARRRGAAFLFLSTSRVYPIGPLNALPFEEGPTRFRWLPGAARGLTPNGIAEDFPLEGPRSVYGASKLAGELLVQEYVYNYGLKALVNRCGILTGPWQMGKVDQGVITLWVARHTFDTPLQYIGFGGEGKQVRDILHVEDLFDLLVLQLNSEKHWTGEVFNVGGGQEVSVSLRELTEVCARMTGKRVNVTPVPETSSVDLRIYLTDNGKARAAFGWQPRRGVEQIVRDIHQWLHEHQAMLRGILE